MRKILILLIFFITLLFSNSTTNENSIVLNNSHKILAKHIRQLNFLTQEEQQFLINHPIIKVGGEMDWPPYDFVKDGQYQGIANDYLTLISKKLGITFDIQTGYTWVELLNMIKNKKLDILPMLSFLPERERFLLFTKPYINTRQYAYVLNSNTTITKIEDLNGKTIAVPKGYAPLTILQRDYPLIKIVETQNVLDSIDHLITQKVDALIENNALVNYLIKDNNISSIKPIFHISTATNKLNMGVRNDWEVLRDILDKTLRSITQEERNLISNRWIGAPLKQESITFTTQEKKFILNNPIVKVTNLKDWEPYDFSEENQAHGYLVDYMKLLGEKSGLQFRFITQDWHEHVQSLQNRSIDVALALQKNMERAQYLNFTKPYFDQNRVIIVQKHRTEIKGMQDLIGKTLAVGKGWNFTKVIRKNFPEIITKEYASSAEMIKAVSLGQVDATIDDSTIANYYISKHALTNLTTFSNKELSKYSTQLHMGIRKDWPLLKSILEKSMDNISIKELGQLNKKWNSSYHKITTVLNRQEQNYLASKVFKLTATKQWAPFSFHDAKTNKVQGISIDFWELIARKGNIKFEYNFQDNFPNVLKSIQNKEQDIIFSTGETPERKAYANFSKTYQSFPIVIATQKDHQFISSLINLKNKKIAVGKNYTAYKIVSKEYPDLNFVFTKNTSEALELVASGQADAAIDIAPTLIHYINSNGFTNLKVAGHTGYDMDFKFMVRKDYESIIPILNKLIDTVSPQERQAIFEKWFSVQYEKGIDYTLLWQVILGFTLIVGFVVYKNRQLVNYQNIIQSKSDKLEQQKQELESSHELIKQTQDELKASLENFTTLVDSTLEAIVIVSDEKIVYVNDEAVKLFKEPTKEYLNNKSLQSLFSEISQVEILQVLQTCSIDAHELVAVKSNKETFPVLVQTKEILFKNEQAKIISIIDLTELKEKEKVIQEQSKLASMGEMIGNIAHQWRQPLSIISTSASGLKMAKKFNTLDEETFEKSIHNILNNTKFLSQTIDDFKNFIMQTKELVHFNLVELISKTLVLIEASLGSNHIEVLTEIEEDISLFNYENEINQALINIINNSKDALKENNADNERFIFIKAYRDNENAIIKVRDNGGGIDEEIIHKVFEPYFTTKHQSQGTGLGLYMTHKLIAESIKGSVTAENISFIFKEKHYKGAELCITIPLFKRNGAMS